MMPIARRHLSSGFSLDDAIPSLTSGLFITPTIATTPEASAPATSSFSQSLSTPKNHSSYNSLSIKRKRAHGQDARYTDSPLIHWGPFSPQSDPTGDDEQSESRYTLAGQIESPGNSPSQSVILDNNTPYTELGYRRALGETRDLSLHTESSLSVQTSMPNLALSPLPVLASKSAPSLSPSAWSRIPLIGVIGGVVGKMWQFCTASGTSFEGFSAGGGKEYMFKDNDSFIPRPGSSSRIPGQFPGMEADYIYDCGDDSDCTPLQPAVKRRQISENLDEIKRNWIIVDEKAPKKSSTARRSFPRGGNSSSGRVSLGASASNRRLAAAAMIHPSTPPKRQRASLGCLETFTLSGTTDCSSPTGASPRLSRALSRASMGSVNPFATSLSSDTVLRDSASDGPEDARLFSPPRRPHSRQKSASTANAFSSPQSLGTSPRNHGHRRTHSSASAGQGRTRAKFDVADIHASPRLDAVAKQLATKKIIEDRDTDARINNFNARLKEMIRQGKEALGTTIEVDEADCGDGSWEDDE
ncbi:hypothetical protein BROUX41_005739 [Berkeleyomyces rouxiae]|uniref:uncharacterized protein n=1 Tax=Berkeleyomyces rouxiae TaxID=2035830 RepID=UPI003B7AC584